MPAPRDDRLRDGGEDWLALPCGDGREARGDAPQQREEAHGGAAPPPPPPPLPPFPLAVLQALERISLAAVALNVKMSVGDVKFAVCAASAALELWNSLAAVTAKSDSAAPPALHAHGEAGKRR